LKTSILFSVIFIFGFVFQNFSQNFKGTLIYKIETGHFLNTENGEPFQTFFDTLEVQVNIDLYSYKKRNETNYFVIDYKNENEFLVYPIDKQAEIITKNGKKLDSTSNIFNFQKHSKFYVAYRQYPLISHNSLRLISIGNKIGDLQIEDKVVDSMTVSINNVLRINCVLLEIKEDFVNDNLFELPKKIVFWDGSKGKYMKWNY